MPLSTYKQTHVFDDASSCGVNATVGGSFTLYRNGVPTTVSVSVGESSRQIASLFEQIIDQLDTLAGDNDGSFSASATLPNENNAPVYLIEGVITEGIFGGSLKVNDSPVLTAVTEQALRGWGTMMRAANASLIP